MLSLTISQEKKQGENTVSHSLSSLFLDYQEKKRSIEFVSQTVGGHDGVIGYFLRGNCANSHYANQIFDLDGAMRALNAEFWQKAINLTDVLDCMPAKEREEWGNNIQDMKTPDFTKENVIPTLQSLLDNRGSLLSKKVEGLFYRLSGNHVTNSPMAFGKTMIIEYVLDSYGSYNYRTAEYIHDLRTIIAKLMGRDNMCPGATRDAIHSMIQEKNFGEWVSFDGGAFDLKIFKKGTAHMRIHPEIAADLNNILAELHPSSIAASARKKSPKTKEHTLRNDFLSKETVDSLCTLVDRIKRGYDIAGKNFSEELSNVLKYLGGENRGASWVLPDGIVSGMNSIIRMGVIPNKESHQYYPTKETLARMVVDMADIQDGDKILEPSAGQGGIADLLPKDQVTCVEINQINCEILREKGFKRVECKDFLSYEDGQFDKIIMNPPFSEGRAKAHIEHALKLLCEGGTLVAILPASMKGKVFAKDGQAQEWSDSFTGEFDDTGVSVAILKVSGEE